MTLRRLLLAATALLPVLPAGTSPVQAQDDVEMLGRIHGTRPPAAYYEWLQRHPQGFSFDRAWMRRNPRLELVDVAGPGPPELRILPERGGGDPSGEAGRPAEARSTASAAGADDVVEGTIHVPLVLGYYSSDPVPPVFTRDEVQSEFFDGPNSYHETIPAYYAEVSGGRLDLQGVTFDWVESELTEEDVAGGSSGLGASSRVGEFIVQILRDIDDGSVDWGMFDNDGPDGVPNSGDDDGYVDVLAVMHSNYGAECGDPGQDDRVWSHKWTVANWLGAPYVTATPSNAEGMDFIRVDDYTIQPVLSCDGRRSSPEINQIGVLTHELGHGLGLPDLYAVGAAHEGIGRWGLMGQGNWGCFRTRPEQPCHLSAWSKALLGWVDVETLPADADLPDLLLGPVETTEKVFRVDARDGSDEYFLLSNRQPVGFDGDVASSGLLVWHIAPDVVESRLASNTVNSNPDRMGVWLRQADGLNELAERGGDPADPGDAFPGETGNTAFHAGSIPQAYTHDDEASGLTILDIAEAGDEVRMRVLTRFQSVTVRTEGADGAPEPLSVDGVGLPPEGTVLESAPFQTHRIAAEAGPSLGEGVRTGFLEWSDDASLPRERTWVTGLEDAELVAHFGGREVRLAVDVEGTQSGVAAGDVVLDPIGFVEDDGTWFTEGTAVTVEALATTGYRFLEWTGGLEGEANPTTVELTDPLDAAAVFELTYAVAGDLTAAAEAGRRQEIVLEAENGAIPVTWSLLSGPLPRGMAFSQEGRIEGVPLETGDFPLTVTARDARGLEATAEIVLEIEVPVLAVADLTGPFLLQPHGLLPTQMDYLDAQGNDDGDYDVGDFRTFFLEHGPLPETVAASTRAESTRVVLPVLTFGSGGGR